MPKVAKMLVEKDKLRGLVPASENGKKDEVYGAYLQRLEIETSASIQLALAQSADPRFRRFLELMSSPNRTTKIQTVAKQCGIDLIEFGNWFSKAANQIAIAEAQLRAAGIVSDMAGDALTRDEFCERCDGLGWIAAAENLPVETVGYRILGMKTVKGDPERNVPDRDEPLWCRTCPKCKGKTTVREAGDEHARERVLEIAGVIQRGGKAGVSIIQNFGGAGHTAAVSGAMSALTIDVEAEDVTDDDSDEDSSVN